MITIETFTYNAFDENTFILFDNTKECVIVDAGCIDSNEKNELASYITANGLKPVKLLTTHGHLDHVFGNKYVVETYNIPSEANKLDEPLMLSAKNHASMYGFACDDVPPIANALNDNDSVKFGNSELKVLHVPGHSPGSIAFHSESENFVIVGDVLFHGSIGRTDLPGGDFHTLIRSIKTKLMVLNEQTIVYPGHGEVTTIKAEKHHNPFLK